MTGYIGQRDKSSWEISVELALCLSSTPAFARTAISGDDPDAMNRHGIAGATSTWTPNRPKRDTQQVPEAQFAVPAADNDMASTIDPKHDPDAVAQTPEQIKQNELRWQAQLAAMKPEVRAFFDKDAKAE